MRSDAYPPQLLDDYLAVSRRRHPTALYATALRTGSVAARRLLARAANPSTTLEELIRAATAGEDVPGPVDVAALADLAGVVALQNARPGDVADGLALYDLASRRGGPARIPSRHQGIHAQLVYRYGDHASAARLLRTYRSMPAFVRSTLELDLANPFTVPGADAQTWLARLNALLPAPSVGLTGEDAAPFDRLTATAAPNDTARLITVVVSAYHPGTGLLTSVRSLLAQSWRHLEILVVDDGSPAEYDAVLAECDALDERVTVIRLPHNGGTYTARNTALDVARGEFVTFHDSDDWAHPLRLETQVTPLLRQPRLMATVSHALTVSDELVVTKPGRSIKPLCTPSTMFRKEEVTARLGYFDSIRKAADTEYLRRITAVFGGESLWKSGQILTLMRQGADSLSRAEFRAGWKHPAREAYQSAYQPWHHDIRTGIADPHLKVDAEPRPFAVPGRFAKRRPQEPQRYDVVLACDWRPFGGPQKSMLEEIAALTGAGVKVAVLHLESFRHMTELQKPLCRPIQELINSGTVGQVLPTDEVETRLLVLRYPPVLQFRAGETTAIRPERMVILANQAPSEMDGSDLRYVPSACTEIARELFGVAPVWYPQGPAARAALVPLLPPEDLASDDMPGIIDVNRSVIPRHGFRSELPVVGRHSRDDWTKWPADAETLLRVYPDSPDVDVRIMGGAKSAGALLGGGEPPANWLVYRRDELQVDNFLRQLDFYVYFPHPNMIEAFGRAILEALAAGCVTILPRHFEAVFGDAAIYCEPAEVAAVVAEHRADPSRFLAQSRLAQQRVRERFSHQSYLDLIRPLLTAPAVAPALPQDSAPVGTATAAPPG
ncbi:glycosyltransferase [Stackebrandtia albiflava]|uniref:glycosyltransferase n=1 Tax=Stackebrandtia albiflava TaxID=406432 RepID=UPI001B866936|nr:glycosyltransferase [Stackebrandtia albiflava]